MSAYAQYARTDQVRKPDLGTKMSRARRGCHALQKLPMYNVREVARPAALCHFVWITSRFMICPRESNRKTIGRPPPRGTVVASLGASDVLVALGEESGLPDPTGAVVAFAFLFAAFAYTQFDMVGVTDQEELEGAEGARRARDALARKRGYFRK